MKIGILTFHCAHNYGAVLQVFALKTYLQNLGHEVNVIDYQPDYLLKPYRIFRLDYWFSKNPIKAILKPFKEILLFFTRIKKFNKFEQFIYDNLELYPYNPITINETFNLVLLGSDQIWNSKLTKGKWDNIYFGKPFDVSCCSYAASMGWDTVDVKREDLFLSLIKNLSAISVREEKLYFYLKEKCHKQVSLVCDPVFLLSKDIWQNYFCKINCDQPYVLCYNLIDSSECFKQAEIVSRKLGYQLIEIKGYVKSLPILSKHELLNDLGPQEFISYIANASFVVSSSFHGTAFSLIFQKSFYAVGMGNRKGRVVDLLSKINLSDRVFDTATHNIKFVDYSDNRNTLLNNYILESKSYLQNDCINKGTK